MVGETGHGYQPGPEDSYATVDIGPDQHRKLARVAEQHEDSAAARENRARAEEAEAVQPTVVVSPELLARESRVQAERLPEAQAQAHEAAVAAQREEVSAELLSRVREIVHFNFGGQYEYSPSMDEPDRELVLDNWPTIVEEIGEANARKFIDNIKYAAVDEDTFSPEQFSVLQRNLESGGSDVHGHNGNAVDRKPKQSFLGGLGKRLTSLFGGRGK
ncbi:hypothetical protein H6758_05370 [Candidatus Nomurabacteria bacterium]|nr:hypothetical protein [Candidatus Nomurabacteria bacterium]